MAKDFNSITKEKGHEMQELHDKVIEGAKKFLERRNYEVISREWEAPNGYAIDLVAKDNDDDCLVFIEVNENTDKAGGFKYACSNRHEVEIAVAMWLSGNSDIYSDIPVRFDSISMIVLSEDRAFLRHHKNCFDVA